MSFDHTPIPNSNPMSKFQAPESPSPSSSPPSPTNTDYLDEHDSNIHLSASEVREGIVALAAKQVSETLLQERRAERKEFLSHRAELAQQREHKNQLRTGQLAQLNTNLTSVITRQDRMLKLVENWIDNNRPSIIERTLNVATTVLQGICLLTITLFVWKRVN